MPSVLITGANKGLGRELLDVYIVGGWTVFPLVRRKVDAHSLAAAHSPRCFPVIGDVTSDSVIRVISDVLMKHTTSLDLLINNAGNIKKKRGIDNADPDDLLEHFNVHCAGALRCTKSALPFLRKGSKPAVVNISSRWGSIARTAAGRSGVYDSEAKLVRGLVYAYQIAKSAQNMLTACLHQDLRNDNIRVFAVHPGRLRTSVAAADADTDPREAAEKLYRWLQQIDDTPECEFYDLMNDEIIEW